MANLNFPSNPSVGDTYTPEGLFVIYTWNGEYWEANSVNSFDSRFVELNGDNMTGNLTLGGDKITLDAADGSAQFASTVKAENIDGLTYNFDVQRQGENLGGFFADSGGSYCYLKPTGGGNAKIELNGGDGSATFAGNVGIGNTSGSVRLNISGNSAATQAVDISAKSNNPVQLALTNGYGARQGVVFSNNGSTSYSSFGIISENTALTFKTANYNIGNSSDLNTGWTERMRIEKSGAIVLPAGSPGIQFGSVSGSVTSTSLDDYEEGTFTPNLSTNIGTFTGNERWGKYTKIGNTVYVWFLVVGSNSQSANLHYLTGLPFTVAGMSGAYPGPAISNAYGINLGTNGTTLGGYWSNGKPELRFHSYGNDTPQLSPSVGTGKVEIRGEGFYSVS